MFRMTHLALAVAVGAGGTAVAGVAATGGSAASALDQRANAVIRSAEGAEVGKLSMDDAEGGGVRITVEGKGLPAGYHGLHLHEKGVCDASSKDPATGSPFFSAGAHLDVDGGHDHAHHTGDLPDLLINENGTGAATTVTDRFQPDQLFDADGTSVIIHVLADNQANVPDRYKAPDGTPGPDPDTLKAGDSGGRLACGIIEKP